MLQTRFSYLNGTPEEVRYKRTMRSVSSIDSSHVRQALLTPSHSTTGKTLVIGVFQQSSYLNVPAECEEQLELYTQEAVRAFSGADDPYPSELISMVYHGGRTTAEEIKKQLPPEPLERIDYIDSLAVPRFSTKILVPARSIENYGIFISHVRRADVDSGAARLLHLLEEWKTSYGLTRIEALQHLVLQQSNIVPSVQYKNACHEFHVLFGYWGMLSALEKQHMKELTQQQVV